MTVERIQTNSWRCSNCEGWQDGEVTAFVDGSGWCRGCVRRLKHWWAWLIPAPPNNPMAALLWGYGATALVMVIGVTVYSVLRHP